MAAVTHSNGNRVDSDDDGPEDRIVPANGTAKPGFFTVYKKGQGYYTRLGTALGAMLLIVVMGLFVYQQSNAIAQQYYPGTSRAVPAGLTAVVVAIGSIIAWRVMNAAKSADFLISTDSEMKKVNWPTRQELFGSTRVVIIFLFVIALLLFLIDVVTGLVFQIIGLLKFGILS